MAKQRIMINTIIVTNQPKCSFLLDDPSRFTLTLEGCDAECLAILQEIINNATEGQNVTFSFFGK